MDGNTVGFDSFLHLSFPAFVICHLSFRRFVVSSCRFIVSSCRFVVSLCHFVVSTRPLREAIIRRTLHEVLT